MLRPARLSIGVAALTHPILFLSCLLLLSIDVLKGFQILAYSLKFRGCLASAQLPGQTLLDLGE